MISEYRFYALIALITLAGEALIWLAGGQLVTLSLHYC